MDVRFRHANPAAGNESTVLYFRDEISDAATVVLVDAGDGVDVDAALADDERLGAILLTHAHVDHYLTLSENVRDGVPVYATPTTADVLDDVLAEADANYEIGDPAPVLEAVEPITDWTALTGDVRVRPVPAGHAPGAAGFLVAFDDAGRTRTILATGDFTARRAGGYRGLPVDELPSVDVLFLTGSTREDVTDRVTDAIASILERARGGSRVLVTAGGLRGVRLAYLLGHASRSLQMSIPITLAGQAAKLYETLEYDVPLVETTPVFSDPGAVMSREAITIAGPGAPIEGSARRLFEVIEDDPAAALFQVGSGVTDPVESAKCTVETYAFSNHPPRETVDGVVAATEPVHVVVKHQRGRALGTFREAYDDSFVWATTDEERFALYESGNWTAPPWMSERGVRHVLSRHSMGDERSGDDPDIVPTVGRSDDVDLAAEGVDVDAVAARLHVASNDAPSAVRESGTVDVASGAANSEGPNERGVRTDGASPSDAGGAPKAGGGSDTDRAGSDVTLSDLDRRLEAIESTLGAPPVDARVVDAGDDLVLLRLADADAAADLEHGEDVTVRIRRTEE